MNKHIDCSVCIHKSICADYNKTHSVDYTPDYDCVCSECGTSGLPYNNYCSNCGARMDGDK